MPRSLPAYVLLLLFPAMVQAQFPSLKDYSVSKLSTVDFPVSRKAGKGKNKAEVPPWIIPGGLRSYFFVDGSETYIWSSDHSLVHDRTLDLDHAAGPALASKTYISSPGFAADRHIDNWKRNYYAIYSAQYIQHPTEGPVSIGFLHGENKNQVTGKVNSSSAKWYQNTIQSNVPINPNDHQTYSGGTPYGEGWNAYNAMISAAWTPNNATTNWGQQLFSHELGPIAWPSTGYVTKNGIKCTSGLKHPSSIIAGEYLYVFYADGGPFGDNIPEEEGRLEGIKVVRAPVSKSLDPAAYEVYYKDKTGREQWLPSLPGGFTKETMLDYVAVRGPQSTDLMQDEQHASQEIRFSVAKVRYKDYFIGVEEYIDIADKGKFKVALRFSRNLTTWTSRALVVYEAPNWEQSRLNYPIFLDKEGWSNTEVDLDDFYILGAGITPQEHVNRIHISPPATTAQLTVSGRALQEVAHSNLYPNPTSGSFRLSYQLDEPSRVQVYLLDMTGRNHGVIYNELRNQGSYTATLDIQAYPAGLYMVKVVSNNQRWLYRIIRQ